MLLNDDATATGTAIRLRAKIDGYLDRLFSPKEPQQHTCALLETLHDLFTHWTSLLRLPITDLRWISALAKIAAMHAARASTSRAEEPRHAMYHQSPFLGGENGPAPSSSSAVRTGGGRTKRRATRKEEEAKVDDRRVDPIIDGVFFDYEDDDEGADADSLFFDRGSIIDSYLFDHDDDDDDCLYSLSPAAPGAGL